MRLYIRNTLTLFALLMPMGLLAQDNASLTGFVVDRAQAPLSEVTVRVVSAAQGIPRETATLRDGGFAFDQLPPGVYLLECHRSGFEPLRVPALALNSRQVLTLSLELAPASASASVQRIDNEVRGISTSPSSATSIDGNFARYLPVSGGGVIQLLPLASGFVTGAAMTANPNDGVAHLHANGLRWNYNNILMDGVSANGGSTALGILSSRGIGAGEATIPMDALEEITVEMSPVTAAIGRSSGAQVFLRSRAGANDTHGSLFGYLRNDALAATDWFADAAGIASAPVRYRQFGGSLGGALHPNRTFYFLSYEDLNADIPRTSVFAVPDATTRASATPALQPYLNAFPLPNGAATGDGTGSLTTSTLAKASSKPFSGRLDYRPSDSHSLFFRYSSAGGDRLSRGANGENPAVLTDMDFGSRQFTAASRWSPSPRITNDLRGTYGRQSVSSWRSMDRYAGAVPIPAEDLLPEDVSAEDASFQFNVLGLGGFGFGRGPAVRQEQVQVADTLSFTQGAHSFQFGIDYRRLFSSLFPASYSLQATFGGLQGSDGSLLSGLAAGAVVARNESRVSPVASSVSFFGQDTWRVTERLSLHLGLRWELNPAPSARNGPAMVTYDGSSGVTRFDSLYDTRKTDLAPRLGLAYRLDTTPGRELVFRAGGAMFREPGYGNLLEYFGGAPYSSQRILSLTAFPLTDANRAQPLLPTARPYGQVNGTDPYLVSPRILEWNVALEKQLGGGQSLSAGYAGTSGRNLLTTETQPVFNSVYTLLRVVSNAGESDYRGLHVNYRQASWHGLTTITSYAWGHALDNASEDHAAVLPGFATTFGQERGNSDFDVRQAFSMAGSYSIPVPAATSGILGQLLRDWHAEWLLSARTGLPFDVRTLSAETSDTDDTVAEGNPGLFALVRADYLGLPVWITDAGAPGGKRLNPDAFAIPDAFEQGTLGRNSLRGFGFFQADLSLRREIPLGERWRVQLQAQALNAFNRANFTNPSLLQGAYLGGAPFGTSTALTGTGGGLSPLYGQGGPRTIQFGLRLEF